MIVNNHIKLLNVQTELARSTPFMAPLVLSLSFEPDPTIPTCATSEAGTTYFNPKYVQLMAASELQKVLYHEALHLFLDYFGRRHGRENMRWNVAHDLEIAAEVQPPNCITPGHFSLRDGLLAEAYYPRIPETKQKPCSHYLVADRDAPDDHIKRAILESADAIIKSGRGTVSGNLRNRAIAILQPTTGDEKLRRIQGALLSAGDTDYSYSRFNRRAASRRGGPILPALVHREARVMCVFDVSGSMSGRHEPAGKALLGAVKCVGSGLDVVAWDTEAKIICNVRTARDIAKIPQSGGGTNMAAAIMFCAARARYDAIFVVTDCDTPWPRPSDAKHLPPIYILRIGDHGGVPKWMTLIQAD